MITPRYTIGDQARGLIVVTADLETDAVLDVAGWTATLVLNMPDLGKEVEITGVIRGATTEGRFLFDAVGNSITLAEAGPRREVICVAQVAWIDATPAPRWSSKFSVVLQKSVRDA
jgi:hypothetical protein